MPADENILDTVGTPSAHFTPVGTNGSAFNKFLLISLTSLLIVVIVNKVIDSVSKFWELAECSSAPILSPEDAKRIFKKPILAILRVVI